MIHGTEVSKRRLVGETYLTLLRKGKDTNRIVQQLVLPLCLGELNSHLIVKKSKLCLKKKKVCKKHVNYIKSVTTNQKQTNLPARDYCQ